MSTAQTVSSTSNIQLIIDDALAGYAKITGIDLSDCPFAAALEQSSSPEDILQLLQGREMAFKEYRDGDRRLIGCLSPSVKVLQAFSGIMGEAAGMVSHTTNHSSLLQTWPRQIPFPPANILFAGIDTLLAVRALDMSFNRSPSNVWDCQAASGVSSSYDALLDLFECLGNFLRRLEIYAMVPSTPIMTDIFIKIMVELLSVLALATKQIKQGRFSKCAVIYIARGSTYHREVCKEVVGGQRD